MSGAIKAGDLVMVVRGRVCCGALTALGKTFVVTEITMAHGAYCNVCGSSGIYDAARTGELSPRGKHMAVELSRLLRIDPPALPESIQDAREVVV